MKSRRVLSVFLGFAFLLTGGSLLSLCATPPASPQRSSPAAAPQSSTSDDSTEEVSVPGPLRSFLRMAAISQKITPEEVLPLLARNVVMSGYEGGKPTEFLVLLNWYMDQARELQTLAGKGDMIRVASCDDANRLLVILGYRLQKSCGPDEALETADANRAFLTIDSGFPLADLEQALRDGKPFETPYASAKVPVLYKPSDWVQNKKNANRGVVDSILRDPDLARLYWAMSRMDTQTGEFLWKSLGPKKLILDGSVLDFYGSQISVRSGRVLVPGGAAAENAWRDLVGANPRSPAEFISKLLARDSGWEAAYYDTLARVSPAQQAYFTSPRRLERFYNALRGHDITPVPTKHSFRPDPALFLLEARLQVEANGEPHIPGSVEVWRDVLRAKTDSKLIKEWAEKSRGWNNPEQVVEGMIGVSRYAMPSGPVYNFLMLTEIDRERAPGERLDVPTARLLAEKFPLFGDQYPMFAEFHALNNESVTRFLAVAEGLNQIPDRLTRTDALGMLQANLGLWQILARQGQIPDARLNDSWQKILNPFATLKTSDQVYTAGRTALSELLPASTGKPYLTQDEMFTLLAGPEQYTKEAQQLRSEMAGKIRQVIDDQRLVSLDTIISLGDGLDQMAKGKQIGDSLVALAGELREFEMPKPLFTKSERTEFAAGLYSNRHTALQMRTDLIKVLKAPNGTPADFVQAHALLTPFLRDTLVGLNYAYYEPPGAQMMHNNPLFVRSHDFSGGDYSGEEATASDQVWRSPRIFGRGWTASGGAHLIGSMADLPYALARVEQDFIVPQNVQSLIWEDLVPGLITSAVLPRWWSVSRNELHAVALYQRSGEELITAAAQDEKVRERVMTILSDCMLPQRLGQLEEALRAGHDDEALSLIAPADSFNLAVDYRRLYSSEKNWGLAGKELDDLLTRFPLETNAERISQDFGVPHPALAQNYGRELINIKPIPTFLYYSSRLMAESWDSGNLYWGRLADEMGYSPVMLNVLVPQLTRRMVEQTFASHLEDWSAVLRAMRETGEEFRQGKIASVPKSSPSAGL
jgi:hypothetical protein